MQGLDTRIAQGRHGKNCPVRDLALEKKVRLLSASNTGIIRADTGIEGHDTLTVSSH